MLSRLLLTLGLLIPTPAEVSSAATGATDSPFAAERQKPRPPGPQTKKPRPPGGGTISGGESQPEPEPGPYPEPTPEVAAEDDDYEVASGYIYALPVFENDTYPSDTRVEWYHGYYGEVRLGQCSSGFTCLEYEMYDSYEDVTDQFTYTIYAPDGSYATATVEIYIY